MGTGLPSSNLLEGNVSAFPSSFDLNTNANRGIHITLSDESDFFVVARERGTMAAKDWIVDLSTVDLNQVFANIDEIRACNPQRFEMEQLSAIILVDEAEHICLGYKDITESEFWIRGHMPNMPLMPGVVMCESAAQLCSFYTQRFDLLGADMVGFGGLDEVRFRDMVKPGDRFYVACKLIKARRNRMIVANFQGYVEDRLVVDGVIRGIPLNSPEK